MNEAGDLYAVLGVAPNSDDVVIRAAFKALMLKYHPDTNRSADATKRASAINAAFSILGDPARRASYDATRAARSADPQKSPPPPPPPPPGSRARPEALPDAPRSIRANVIAGEIGVLVIGALIISSDKLKTPDRTPDPATMGALDNLADPPTVAIEPVPNPFSSDVAAVDATMGVLDNSAEPMTSSLSQSPEPVKFEVIEGAAGNFVRAVSKGGMAAARTYSLYCHKKTKDAASWRAADDCAAFDYAAAYADATVAGRTNATPLPYFSFQRANQADYYTELGAPAYLMSTRLRTIRETAEAAVTEALSTHFARKEAQEAVTSRPQPEPSGLDADAALQDGPDQ